MTDSMRGEKMGFIGDILFLTDSERGNNFGLTQFNYLLGLVFKQDSLRLQFDREEDKPLDRKGLSYRYWDVRAGLVFGRKDKKKLPVSSRRYQGLKAGRGSMMRGVLTAGWFLHNNSFPARSDLSGTAFLRYNARGELGTGDELVKIVAEADFLTDEHRGLHPAEMHLSYGLAFQYKDFQLAVTRETDDTLDRPGYGHSYLTTITYPFGVAAPPPRR